MGILSTENRKVWSRLRNTLSRDKTNADCLRTIDNALFVVCLDDTSPKNLSELCANYLCGSYDLRAGVQVGTCTNRWYDKVYDPNDAFTDPNVISFLNRSRSSCVRTVQLVSTLSTQV
jgi:hypothetical protein